MSKSTKNNLAKHHRRCRWSRKDRLLLIERLEMYVSAGIPVDKALAAGAEGLPDKQKLSLNRARIMVEGGQSLSDALIREVRLPATVTGLISCGESSGILAQALISGRLLMEREDELIKKCASAMAYPIVIGLAAIGLTIGLVRGVMPQIIPLLLGLHSGLPLLTRIVMSLSDASVRYGLYVLVGCAVLLSLLILLYRNVSQLRRLSQSILIRIPLIGGLAKRYSLALFFQSFGSLVESGMAADLAYQRTMNSISLIPLQRMLEIHADRIIHGGSIHGIFLKGVPAYIAPLVSAGEASGNLGVALVRIAGMLDREIDHSLKRLTSLIEPVMMLVMGVCVGSVALSIMMPIYDISRALQH